MNDLLLRSEIYYEFSVLFSQPNEENFPYSHFIRSLNLKLIKIGAKVKCTQKEIDILVEEKSLEEIVLEYSRIFLGPFKVLVPPYGSYFIEKQKLLNQESTVKVEQFYSKMGVDLSENFYDLPDHIVPELEFMHFLTYKETEFETDAAIEVSKFRQAQKEFFDKYFYPFVSNFSEEIIVKTNSKFYSLVAKYLKNFIESERSRLLN